MKNIIKVSDIIKIDDDNRKKYKFHAARDDGKNKPLKLYVNDPEGLKTWNGWRTNNDAFKDSDYIFFLIDFYHEKNMWLFGGLFKIVGRNPVKNDYGYEVELLDDLSQYIGRLKIHCYIARNKAPHLDTYWDQLVVDEILSEPFSGQYPYKL